MLGLKSLSTAEAMIGGIELAGKIQKRQSERNEEI
jgi:hypothetical protein